LSPLSLPFDLGLTIDLGTAMALGCGLAWAIAVVLFRQASAGEVSARALNLFKNAVASVLLVLTVLIRDGDGGEGAIARLASLSTWDLGRLTLSGVLGLAIADTLFFSGLRRVGSSMAAVADCAYAPTAVILSVLLLGEELREGLLIGGPLVVLGLGIVSWRADRGHTDAAGLTTKLDGVGLLLTLGGVMTTALGVVVAKPALNQADLLEATTLRLLAGTLALGLWEALRGELASALVLFRPQPAWRFAIPATLIGTYLSMLLWLGGIKYSTASKAAILSQLSVVFLLVLSRLTGEPVPPRRWLGAGVALTGALVVVTRA
jgi:drug/metabolite transporter (DMT)-like permease